MSKKLSRRRKSKMPDSTAAKRTCIGRSLTLQRCNLALEPDRLLCAAHRHQRISFPVALVAIAVAIFALYQGTRPLPVEEPTGKIPARRAGQPANPQAPDKQKPSNRRLVGGEGMVDREGTPALRRQPSEPAAIADRVVVQGTVSAGAEGQTNPAVDLAMNLISRARILHAEGKLADAVESLDKGIEVLARLIEKEGRSEMAEDLSSSLVNRAIILNTQGKLVDAMKDYDKAIAIHTRLVEQEGRTELLAGLAAMLNNRGFVLYTQGESDDAIKDYDKSVETYVLLIEQEGRNELRSLLVNALGNRGMALHEQGMSIEAIDDLTRTADILEQLVSEGRIELAEKLQGARQILDDWTNEEPGE